MLPEIKNIKMQQEDIRVNQIGAMDSPQILLPDPQRLQFGNCQLGKSK